MIKNLLPAGISNVKMVGDLKLSCSKVNKWAWHKSYTKKQTKLEKKNIYSTFDWLKLTPSLDSNHPQMRKHFNKRWDEQFSKLEQETAQKLQYFSHKSKGSHSSYIDGSLQVLGPLKTKHHSWFFYFTIGHKICQNWFISRGARFHRGVDH